MFVKKSGSDFVENYLSNNQNGEWSTTNGEVRCKL